MLSAQDCPIYFLGCQCSLFLSTCSFLGLSELLCPPASVSTYPLEGLRSAHSVTHGQCFLCHPSPSSCFLRSPSNRTQILMWGPIDIALLFFSSYFVMKCVISQACPSWEHRFHEQKWRIKYSDFSLPLPALFNNQM